MDSGLSPSTKTKVLIIGGGFAGIGAAHTLSHSSSIELILIEASDKLGGRVHSTPLDGEWSAVELGATVLHGEIGNSLYDLSRDLGVVLHKKADWVPSEVLFTTGGGGKVPGEVVQYYGDVITDLYEEMSECLEREDWNYATRQEWKKKGDTCKPPYSHASYITRRYQDIVMKDNNDNRAEDDGNNAHYNNEWSGGTSDDMEEGSLGCTCDDNEGCNKERMEDDPIWLKEGILDYWMNRENICNATTHPLDIKSAYLDFSFPLGDQSILIEGGYQLLVDKLSNDIPQHIIHLNTCATCIKWTPMDNAESDHTHHPVTVQCMGGSEYSVDHVIVTVSLGVLKSRDLVFDPPLPVAKQRATRRLGMGLMVKVSFQFSAPLVPSTYRKVGFVWRENDRERLRDYPWVLRQHSFHRVGGSNVWVGWFVGDDAKTVQELPSGSLIEGMKKMLSHFLNKSIPDILSVKSSPWGKDPHFQGSYSYCPLGSSSQDRTTLATPIHGTTPFQLLFAGEATNVGLYSTTNGAYDTGVREGLKILELIDKERQKT